MAFHRAEENIEMQSRRDSAPNVGTHRSENYSTSQLSPHEFQEPDVERAGAQEKPLVRPSMTIIDVDCRSGIPVARMRIWAENWEAAQPSLPELPSKWIRIIMLDVGLDNFHTTVIGEIVSSLMTGHSFRDLGSLLERAALPVVSFKTKRLKTISRLNACDLHELCRKETTDAVFISQSNVFDSSFPLEASMPAGFGLSDLHTEARSWQNVIHKFWEIFCEIKVERMEGERAQGETLYFHSIQGEPRTDLNSPLRLSRIAHSCRYARTAGEHGNSGAVMLRDFAMLG